MDITEKSRPYRGFNRIFQITDQNTTIKREFVAGTTTFLAMAWALAVNPLVLSDAGMPIGAVFTATALAAVFGSLMMGLLARFPIALAPGALNAFFAYSVVIGMGINWRVALAGTLVSGVIFLILSISGLREAIVNAIPTEMKLATGAGIGLFIAFIGLKNAGLVVASDATLVTLGDFQSAGALLALFGITATIVCLVRGLRGGVFYGMIATATVGLAVGFIDLPNQIVAAPPSIAPTFGEAIVHLPDVFTGQMLIVIITLLFVDFFDTSGTLFAVTSQAGLLNDGKLPRAGRAFSSDSTATIVGAILGTSTTTSYIESSAGVSVGGRTGLTAVTTACWFLVSLVFFPVFTVFASTPEVTASALIVVGTLMAKSLSGINWNSTESAIPAFLTIIAMPLTFSIANGIALGLLFYPIAMVVKGRRHEVHPIIYGLALVFLGYFFFLIQP